jgi:hypothetical protein
MIPFSGNPLNRASEKRTNKEWIAARRRDPSSRIFPLYRLEPFLTDSNSADASTEIGWVTP